MKKRILVAGVALVLFALVVGMVFAGGTAINAGEVAGVSWIVIEGRSENLYRQETAFYMSVYNTNDYAVTVWCKKGNDVIQKRLSADQLIHVDAYRDSKVIQVKR